MRYVAFLRGINVGGNSKVPMGTLKAVCEKLGLTDVSTYINSGNVLFSIPGKKPGTSSLADSLATLANIAHDIENAVHKECRLTTKSTVLIRSAAQLATLVDALPKTWKNDTEQKTDILFLTSEFDKKATLDLIEQNPNVDTLTYHPDAGAIAWHIDRKDYAKSHMHDFIGTTVYKNMTARTINTVRKLTELMKK